MRRLALLTAMFVAGLLLAAASVASPGGPGNGKGKNKTTTTTTTGTTTTKQKKQKNAKLTFNVVTTDHGCEFRPWATDTIRRTFKVKQNQDGSYTVRRQDKGTFVTLAGKSPSADPCPDVIRRGKHGQLVTAGIKGKLRGYIVGKVTGGTFNPNGTCTAECTNAAFIAGFFTPGTRFTCLEGYAGCRFNFSYTAQKQKKQGLLYHHWVDRGLNGVNETFIGDIATS